MDDDFHSSLVALLSFQGLPDMECVALSKAVSRYIETGSFTDDEPMSSEEKETARGIFEGKTEDRAACLFCGGIHGTVARLDTNWQPCPRVKRVERHIDGTPLVIEYWPSGEWEENVVFPHHVYDD